MNIYPTLIDACGLPLKPGIEAVSIYPLLKNPTQKWKYHSVTTFGRNNNTVRTKRGRYTRYFDGGEELYDHNIAPNEWKNLACDPRFSNIKKRVS